jgi:hypothetical protein
LRYPLDINVKPKDRKVPGHMDGERQTDVAEPNDSDSDIIDAHQGHKSFHPNTSKLPLAAQRSDVKRMAPTPKSSNASLQGLAFQLAVKKASCTGGRPTVQPFARRELRSISV